ncbi:MAG: D-sedoheptulose 7-phosphate isomerase [Saprospiraceae bacterium]
MFESNIKSILSESINTKVQILEDDQLLKKINDATLACIHAFQHDHKVLFCGNGGSAADAQHLAAEFSGRFYKDRPPLYSEALHANTSYITAVSNDYGYEHIYSRLLKGIGRSGDILFGLSTSGNSKNIIHAFEIAKEKSILCIAMTGQSGGKMASIADILINVPSGDTPRIQESHITIGHIICELVEKTLFP